MLKEEQSKGAAGAVKLGVSLLKQGKGSDLHRIVWCSYDGVGRKYGNTYHVACYIYVVYHMFRHVICATCSIK